MAFENKGAMTATIVVAASDSLNKGAANFVCPGANDDVVIQEAIDALPAGGSCIFFLDGIYAFTAQVARAINNIKLMGCGRATIFNLDGATPIFSSGDQTGWIFAHFATDAGGIETTSDNVIDNCWINDVLTNVPSPAVPTFAVGVEWNQSTDTWRRINLNGDTVESWIYSFDELSPWKYMRRVTMSPAGLVNHYGADGKGTGLTLDGTDGRVMVQIPKFWVRFENPSPNVYRYWISPIARAGFEVHPAFNQRATTKPANYIYVSAYEADLMYNGDNEAYNVAHKELNSRSGVQPYTGNANCIWAIDIDTLAVEPTIGDKLTTPNDADFYLVDYVKTAGVWGGGGAGDTAKLWIRKPGGAACGWLAGDTIANDTAGNNVGDQVGAPVGELVDLGSFRTLAGNIGTGWGQINVWTLFALQLLYYIEYADADSQTTIGRGIVNKVTGTGFAGELTGVDGIDANLATNGTGIGTGTSGLTPIAYRGIENLWGNIWKFIDGYNAVDGDVAATDVKYRLINRDGSGTFADLLAGEDYKESSNLTNPADGYIKNIVWQDLLKYAFIGSDTTGNDHQWLYDRFYVHNTLETNILLFGGGWPYGSKAGVVFLNSLHVGTVSARDIGGRLEVRQ